MRDLGKPRVLIAGIGNVFFGDDGFGVEVVRRLAQRSLGSHVRLMDAGVRGIDLAYALLDGYDAAVLIDAVRRGEPPGTLYLIEPELSQDDAQDVALDSHALDPVQVLRFVRAQGVTLPALRLVGCEPAPLGDELSVGLSAAVLRALPGALELVEQAIEELEVPHA